MENIFSSFDKYQLILILIGFIFLASILVFFARSNNIIKASDGTIFSTKEECAKYEDCLENINTLLSALDFKDNDITESFGIELGFVRLLKNKGFSEAKVIIKYRKEFKLLADLVN